MQVLYQVLQPNDFFTHNHNNYFLEHQLYFNTVRCLKELTNKKTVIT